MKTRSPQPRNVVPRYHPTLRRKPTAGAVIAGLSVLVLIAGCARRRNVDEARPYVPPRATVTVQNDNWLDMDVFIVHGGNRIRIGRVTTNGTESFEVPSNLVGIGTIAVLADPLGSNRGYLTPEITLAGHTYIDVRVANVIDQSTYSVAVEEPDDS